MIARASWIASVAVLAAGPAWATLGGPDLTRPLGWDPKTKEAYFAIGHQGEGAQNATIVKLSLAGPDTAGCRPMWWSKQSYEGMDSLYEGRLRRLMKKLVPLKEESATTIAWYPEAVVVDDW